MNYGLNEEEMEVLNGSESSGGKRSKRCRKDAISTEIVPVDGGEVVALADYRLEDYDLECVDMAIAENGEVLNFGIDMMGEQLIRTMQAKARRDARLAKAAYVKEVAKEMNSGSPLGNS